MTGRSIGISLLAHAALLALVLDGDPAPPPPAPSPGTAIEIVELPSPAPTPAPAPAADGTAPPRGAMQRGGRPPRASARGRGELTIAPEVRGSGGGSGSGSGGGTGTGSGAGLGWSPPAGAPPPPPPPPAEEVAAEARSKARPARLIFPRKHRTSEDGPVFTARLEVDAEGYVVGVRLVRGVGGRRDEIAAREVWRFRYDPARDDEGRPIRSRVEQRFMLE